MVGTYSDQLEADRSSQLHSIIEERVKLIDRTLGQLVPELTGPLSSLYEAARYSLLAPGKRLRPLLALTTAEMLGKMSNDILIAACTLEMVHTYSLIHDDLPCMDNDDFRRGKPTLHRVYNEGHAVLVGDFLLTYAFETLAKLSLSSSDKIKLMLALTHGAGAEGMIGGQVIDLSLEGNTSSDIQLIQRMHEQKTGALIAASVKYGAILGGASSEETEILFRFGQKLGLAFQIIDDILDVIQSEQKHGKAESSDQINKKSTFVSCLGIKESKNRAFSLIQSIDKQLSSLSYDTSFLKLISERVFSQI